MKKTIACSTLLVFLTGCGDNKYQSANWASGVPSSLETPQDETLAPEDPNSPKTDPDFVSEVAKLIYFKIDTQPVTLAHGKAVTWLGCEKSASVNGGYSSDTTCGRAFFHSRFEKQMNSKFFTCSERAASRAGINRPKKIFVNHMGSYNNRPARGSSQLSMHAYARALDIANFNLYDSSGKLTRISTHVRNFKGITKTFYDEFRQCWKEAMPASCKPTNSEYKGSIGIPSSALGGNSLHNDHIHLSYALCAG